MKWLVSLCSAGLCLSLLANFAVAQDWHPTSGLPPLSPVSTGYCPPRVAPGCCPAPGMQGMPGTPGTPGSTNPPQPGDPSTQPAPGAQDAFAQSPEAGSLAGKSFDPGIFGDLIGPMGQRIIQLPNGVSAQSKPGQRVLSGNRIAIFSPQPYRGTFKITENESPRPVDRVFLNYNYFDDVTRAFGTIPGGAGNLNRETIGFEKTFLDGDASVGMRLPFLQLTGNSTIDDSQIGDLSFILKFAFINDRQTGDVLSTGVVLTVPTGEGVEIDGESELHSTLIEPWVGYIYHFNPDLFVQGFSSISVPTDARDVTLLFNSVAIGYWLYRDRSQNAVLTGVVPDLEVHVNTPLNHRGFDSGPIGYSDSVDTTVGCYFMFHRATAGLAVCVPLTGPKPYEVEGTFNLNISF